MNKQKLAVAGNKILIRFDDDTKPNKTKSGIHIPDSAKQQYSMGEIIAVGPEVDQRIKVGTRAMWLPNTGAGLKMESGDAIISMRDIDLFYWYTDNEHESDFRPSLN